MRFHAENCYLKINHPAKHCDHGNGDEAIPYYKFYSVMVITFRLFLPIIDERGYDIIQCRIVHLTNRTKGFVWEPLNTAWTFLCLPVFRGSTVTYNMFRPDTVLFKITWIILYYLILYYLIGNLLYHVICSVVLYSAKLYFIIKLFEKV